MTNVWTKEKINKQYEYFKSERINKKGNFTEFVVRVYYCIYKSCVENNSKYCYTKDVRPYKIKDIIYEGIRDSKPDHDFKSVIDDCIKYLKNMNYIKFRKQNNEWFIYLNKELDFLLDGEHEEYLKKYKIIENV